MAELSPKCSLCQDGKIKSVCANCKGKKLISGILIPTVKCPQCNGQGETIIDCPRCSKHNTPADLG